jgi:hypothetical protein
MASRYDPVLVPIVSELLVDKIAKLYAYTRTLRHFIPSKTIMDHFSISNEIDPKEIGNSILCFLDYSLIFKTKAKVIEK